MKRFHVHVAVADLPAAMRFYSTLFGTEPSVTKPDYAKWMLEDPRLNFAISQRGNCKVGINHLGLQTDSDEELEQLNAQLRGADLATTAQKGVACCYARSDKYWVTDPDGVAWETFHSLGTVPTYDERAADSTCCTPASKPAAKSQAAACCG